MKNIMQYDSAYDLLLEEVELGEIEPELLEFLKGFDVFEGISYYVVDYETVLFCDRCSGDVISDCKLEEFLPQLSQYYYETM